VVCASSDFMDKLFIKLYARFVVILH